MELESKLERLSKHCPSGPAEGAVAFAQASAAPSQATRSIQQSSADSAVVIHSRNNPLFSPEMRGENPLFMSTQEWETNDAKQKVWDEARLEAAALQRELATERAALSEVQDRARADGKQIWGGGIIKGTGPR